VTECGCRRRVETTTVEEEVCVSDFSDEELAAELKRRGFTVEWPEYPPSTAAHVHHPRQLAVLLLERRAVMKGGDDGHEGKPGPL
jgi:hypothetical protein